MSLLSRRLNIITGKGGVGKSTLTAAMALCAQARGLRVLVCEITAQERVAGLLGAPDSGAEVRQIDRSIWSVHVRPAESMRQYGLMVLRFKAVYNAVFENRLVRYFLRAVPSLPEIVMLGKVYWHVAQERGPDGRPRWDMVILDAPATGHGLTLLDTPRAVLDLVSEGPMLRDLRAMQQLISDPAMTAVNVVALPEEMPVNEAIELRQQLRDRVRVPGGRCFLNGWVPARFDPEERAALTSTDAPELAPARTALRFYAERQDLSVHHEKRLREEMDLPLTRVPYLFSDRFGRAEIERIAGAIEQDL